MSKTSVKSHLKPPHSIPPETPEQHQRRLLRQSKREGISVAQLLFRESWNVQEPNLGFLPKWIWKRVKAAIKSRKLPGVRQSLQSSWYAMQYALGECGGDWVDHLGSMDQGGKTYIVSEPYQLSLSAHSQLDQFCQILGLEYRLSAMSWWNPGSTIRILIWEDDQ